MDIQSIFDLLESNYRKYNCPEFIENDPISIPHKYTRLQDIEISGFFAATLAWGSRKVILRKGNELMSLMDNSPFDFVMNHSESDLKPMNSFKHRTFNSLDLLYFIHFFKRFYQQHASLETAFLPVAGAEDIESGLTGFQKLFTSDEYFPPHTFKHVSTPSRNSACKRLNMYLRWMVRHDTHQVDFGLWKRIKPSQLVCPCDLHVERVARALDLIEQSKGGWRMAKELTSNLKVFDAQDPVKYDFALFGMGMNRIY
ncbi:MAG: TIGR02757 family protein [Cyclobacteriaceae bacterium]|nr:TIGR02757 family protein [Cyclobacteriaceae bacterium]